MTQDFFIIGGQSNVGTSSKPANLHSDLGYLKYNTIPAELLGVQTGVKVWNGTAFIPFEPKFNAQYGWINYLLKNIGAAKEISFYKFGKGGTQLIQTGPNPFTPRQPLEKNGLEAWSHFKANNPNPRLIFLWCQGWSDGTNLQTSLEYGAHEVANPNHKAGGELGKWFNRIRRIFNEPEMPVIYNTLSNNATGSTYRANIRAGQLHVDSLSINNHSVDSDNLTFLDAAHFNLQGCIDLADKYLTVYNTI